MKSLRLYNDNCAIFECDFGTFFVRFDEKGLKVQSTDNSVLAIIPNCSNSISIIATDFIPSPTLVQGGGK